jgi:hypothetical protein
MSLLDLPPAYVSITHLLATNYERTIANVSSNDVCCHNITAYISIPILNERSYEEVDFLNNVVSKHYRGEQPASVVVNIIKKILRFVRRPPKYELYVVDSPMARRYFNFIIWGTEDHGFDGNMKRLCDLTVIKNTSTIYSHWLCHGLWETIKDYWNMSDKVDIDQLIILSCCNYDIELTPLFIRCIDENSLPEYARVLFDRIPVTHAKRLLQALKSRNGFNISKYCRDPTALIMKLV